MSSSSKPKNLLLAQLPQPVYEQIARYLEPIVMESRSLVCQAGERVRHAYFPTTAMLSSLIAFSDGKAAETSTIGREGIAGVGLLINEPGSPFRVVVQIEGEALRVDADRFTKLLGASETIRDVVQRFTLTLLVQAGQNAACNLYHSGKMRMARWLLQTGDRVGRSDYRITQEFLSEMLGMTRQSINLTARSLQELQLIGYDRGHVRLLDRAGLEKAACECYHLYNAAYQRYLRIQIPGTS